MIPGIDSDAQESWQGHNLFPYVYCHPYAGYQFSLSSPHGHNMAATVPGIIASHKAGNKEKGTVVKEAITTVLGRTEP